jgi:hypothetical protein
MRWRQARIASALSLCMLLSALLSMPGSDPALACACCTDRGQRNVNSVKFDSSRRAQIEQLKFAKPARLFVGPGGLEIVKGIKDPAERYSVGFIFGQQRAVFGFRDHKGRSGRLSLTLPAKLSVFEVDPRDGPDGGTGPSLYKEWKFTGKVSGSGIFEPGNGPNQLLTLILQGRGNSCTSSSDFTHWTLVMQGRRPTTISSAI